jgi:hypothetical protein
VSAYDGRMSDAPVDDDAERDDDTELISRLRVIESQPLADRAGAYDALHEELARRLESGPDERSSSR